MRLNNLKPNRGAKHRRRRVGCGESSGLGKTSGRGNKGQKSRSGSSIRPGFEGGQMPLIRRLPRVGFNNKQFASRYAIVNVSTLEEFFSDGDSVDEASLRAKGLVKGHAHSGGVKILGSGDLSKKLTVSVDKVSATAREKIEKAGGAIAEVAPAAEEAPKAKAKPKAKGKAEAPKAEAEAKAPKAKKAAKAEKPAAEEEAPAEPDAEADDAEA